MTSEFNRSSIVFIIATIIGLAVGVPQIFLSTFTVFVKPLIAEFDWNRSQISLLFSIVTLTMAIAAPIISRLVPRYGIRKVLVGSTILTSAAIALMSISVGGYTSFLLWVVLIGFVGTGTTTFVYISAFPSWFNKRLGIALGIAATGIGIGQMIFPVLAQHLIPDLGWRQTYQILALISLIIALPGALMIIRYKSAANDSVAEPEKSLPKDYGGAFSKPQFWYFAIAIFIVPMIVAGCTLHAMPILLERDLAPARAAKIVALGGLTIMVGRVAAGFLLDWIGARAVAVLACIAAALAPLIFTSYAPIGLVALAPLLYGLALGIEGDLLPFGIRNMFGAERVTALYGIYFGIFNLGVVVGPLLMGITYDMNGSYDVALFILAASAFIALPAFILGLKPSKSQGSAV